MPASLASLVNKRATVHLPLDEKDPDSDIVRIIYRPKAFNAEFEDELNAIAPEKGEDKSVGAAVAIAAFLHVVDSWDLRWHPDDPEPIPLTEDALKPISTEVLIGLLKAIGDDQKPDPKAANGSPKRS